MTSEGFKVTTNKLAQSFGIRAGDTITSMNGYPVNSLYNAWWILQELLIRNTGLEEIHVDIVRRGAKLSKLYRIK
jgi:membrane-associated protease RseP (regulator of RpoE activity)